MGPTEAGRRPNKAPLLCGGALPAPLFAVPPPHQGRPFPSLAIYLPSPTPSQFLVPTGPVARATLATLMMCGNVWGADTGTVVVARALAVDIHAPVVRRCPAACVYKSSHATQASHAAHATRAAAMPPQYAMGELPPPCSTLKNALVQIEGGEESLEGLCPDTMAQSAFQVYHRRACQVIT